MQDNNPTSFDGQFQDYAWEKMSRLLDQEMPQPSGVVPIPQRDLSPWPFALIMVFLLIFGSQLSSTWSEQNIEKPIEIKPIQRLEMEVAGADLEKPSPLFNTTKSVQAINQSPNTSTFVQKPKQNTSAVFERESDQRSEQVSSAKLKKDFSRTLAVVDKLAAISLTVPSKEIKLPAGKLKDQAAEYLNREALDIRDAAFASIEIPYTSLKGSRRTTRGSIEPIQRPVEEMQFGFSAATLSRDLSDLDGFSVGVLSKIPLDPTFSVETGIFYTAFSNRKHSHTLQANSQHNQNAFLTADLSAFSDANMGILPDYHVQYLNVPLMLNYRLNPVLSVSAGLSAGFLVGAQFLEDHYEMLPAKKMEERNQYLKASFRDVDMASVVGLGFRPMEQLEFQIQYRLGLRDYTKNGFYGFRQIDTHRYLQVGLVYFLR